MILLHEPSRLEFLPFISRLVELFLRNHFSAFFFICFVPRLLVFFVVSCCLCFRVLFIRLPTPLLFLSLLHFCPRPDPYYFLVTHSFNALRQFFCLFSLLISPQIYHYVFPSSRAQSPLLSSFIGLPIYRYISRSLRTKCLFLFSIVGLPIYQCTFVSVYTSRFSFSLPLCVYQSAIVPSLLYM